MKKIIALAIVSLVISTSLFSQKIDPEYIKVTNDRAQKIVDGMHLNDTEKGIELRDLIAVQYRNLSYIQDTRDSKIESLKNSDIEESKKKNKVKKLENKADKKIAKLHDKYIKDLNELLSPEEVIEVKDGMTYGVLPKTYVAFQEMLPQLTIEQKETIYNYLVEARERAMDAGSSHMKHWWFGKYKGKINNYLSSEGYDLEKAGEEWQARIKAKKESANQ